jgi:hypothetical protein
MLTDSSQSKSPRHSRRSFLALLTLGIATMAGLAPWLARLGKGNRAPNAAAQEFPGPDSIFHPAQDPRLDERRKSA